MITTHPSNPPADAIDFRTQQSGDFEISNWKQTNKPNLQNTHDAAYKILKIGNQYLVVCARRTTASN
jgi:hypothetical protein